MFPQMQLSQNLRQFKMKVARESGARKGVATAPTPSHPAPRVRKGKNPEAAETQRPTTCFAGGWIKGGDGMASWFFGPPPRHREARRRPPGFAETLGLKRSVAPKESNTRSTKSTRVGVHDGGGAVATTKKRRGFVSFAFFVLKTRARCRRASARESGARKGGGRAAVGCSELYLIGASLKDLGRKCFAFTKLDAGEIRRIKKSAFAATSAAKNA